MHRTILTINKNNPITEFLEDFSDNFFNMNKVLDFNEQSGVSFKNNLLDRTGFPRANIKNISLKNIKKLSFELALPGWNKNRSQIDAYIQDSTLVVKGKDISNISEPNEELAKDYGKYYEHNISSSDNFTWTHTVPENTEIEKVYLMDGILTINVKIPLPKKNEPKHFFINICED